MIDFIQKWEPSRTGLRALQIVDWLGIGRSKYYDWRQRYGQANEHNRLIPRDHWLQDWERRAIIDFHGQYPLEGYRRLTFMMLDRDIVAVSPSSTYRVLKAAGLLDGCSRSIVHFELRQSMTEADVETILQRAIEKFPGHKPRIISDNGPQFIAKDFKEFVRIAGLTHVKTSPYYPQSNGKIERWHKSLKHDCIRPGTPLDLEQARRLIARFVEHYNTVRLHSAIGYITPHDKLHGKEKAIFAARDQKLASARLQRKINRQNQHAHSVTPDSCFSN